MSKVKNVEQLKGTVGLEQHSEVWQEQKTDRARSWEMFFLGVQLKEIPFWWEAGSLWKVCIEILS